MFSQRCVAVAALLTAVLLLTASLAWAAQERSAEEALREKVVQERVLQEKRQAEARAHLAKAQELLEAGRREEARTQLERAVALDPALEEARILLSEVGGVVDTRPADERLLEEEVRHQQVAQEALRRRVEALLVQAAEDRQAQRYDQALQNLRTAGNLVRYSRFREELADLVVQVDRQTEAVGAEGRAHQVRLDQERRREALRLARQRKFEAVAQLRETERGLLSRAQQAFGRGDYDEAAQLARVVTNVNPDNTDGHVLLGRAEQRSSRERFLTLSTRRAEGLRREFADTARSSIPQGVEETIVYPEDWKELSRRRKEAVTTTYGPPTEPWRAPLEDKLQRSVSFDFTETPLSQVVEFLGAVSDASIVLDRRGIQAAGKDPEMPVTLKIRDTSLREALDWLTELSDLTFTLYKGAILISDRTQIPKETYLATYDVRDLLAAVPDFAGPEFDLESESGGGGDTGGFDFADAEGAEEAGLGEFVPTAVSGQALVDFIIEALGLEGEAY